MHLMDSNEFLFHLGDRKLNVPDEDEITPYATLHISGIVGPNVEQQKYYGLPGMYENPLKTVPFHARIPPGESPQRLLRKLQKSPYENIDHLGRPSANPLQYLFFQPRYENEADNGTCDALIIKPGYDKLKPGTRRNHGKKRENCASVARSPYGGFDKSGMPVYDSIIREIELKCRSRNESGENRVIHTILEVASCDERSQVDKLNRTRNERVLSKAEDSDDAISLQDIDCGRLSIDWNGIKPQPLTSSDGKVPGTSRSQAALHMEDQTGLFGFYNGNLTQDAEA